MIELLNSSGLIHGPDLSVSGPGNKTLISGDAQVGFFGEVPVTDFVTGTAIITHLGLTAGTNRSNNDTTPWLKFSYHGKFLFMPKDTLKFGLTWQSIYLAGAVYGTNNTGKYPSGTATNQYKVFTFVEGGKTWRLVPRLIQSASTDPASTDGTTVSAEASEYNDLYSRLTDGRLASYTMAQLGQPATTARLITQTSAAATTASFHMRGVGTTTNWAAVAVQAKATNSAILYWKPVLELIPD